VRSHGNNIAVNVWWKHSVDALVSVDKCHESDSDISESLTLDKLTLHSDEAVTDDTLSLR